MRFGSSLAVETNIFDRILNWGVALFDLEFLGEIRVLSFWPRLGVRRRIFGLKSGKSHYLKL